VVLEVQWSVRDRDLYRWVPNDCPPWCYPTSLVVLRQIRTAIRIGELDLVLWIVVVTRLFQCVEYWWWLVVGGASRHSWQQGSINVIIKGGRIKRRSKENVNVGCDGWDCHWNYGLKIIVLLYIVSILFELTLSACVGR